MIKLRNSQQYRRHKTFTNRKSIKNWSRSDLTTFKIHRHDLICCSGKMMLLCKLILEKGLGLGFGLGVSKIHFGEGSPKYFGEGSPKSIHPYKRKLFAQHNIYHQYQILTWTYHNATEVMVGSHRIGAFHTYRAHVESGLQKSRPPCTLRSQLDWA